MTKREKELRRRLSAARDAFWRYEDECPECSIDMGCSGPMADKSHELGCLWRSVDAALTPQKKRTRRAARVSPKKRLSPERRGCPCDIPAIRCAFHFAKGAHSCSLARGHRGDHVGYSCHVIGAEEWAREKSLPKKRRGGRGGK